jgi:hypothetical protein
MRGRSAPSVLHVRRMRPRTVWHGQAAVLSEGTGIAALLLRVAKRKAPDPPKGSNA